MHRALKFSSGFFKKSFPKIISIFAISTLCFSTKSRGNDEEESLGNDEISLEKIAFVDPAFTAEIEKESELPPFSAKPPKAGRIIENKNFSDFALRDLNARVAEIFPRVEFPFSSGTPLKFVAKRKMLPPEISKNKERQEQKTSAGTKSSPKTSSKTSQQKTAVPERKLSKEEIATKKRKKDLEAFFKIPISGIVEHPAAENFPGTFPKSVSRVIRPYVSDNEIRGWQCTGLYAPAGEIVPVHVATAGINSGYKIRVGAHSDNLAAGTRKNSWKRFPKIVREFSANNSTVQIANPFGGMIYVWAPKPPTKKKISTSSQARVPQRVRFQFVGVVEAPQFILGKTKAADWKNSLRFAPAPWCEFRGEYFSAILPSAAIRNIENPTKIIEFWDKIFAEMDKFSGRENKQEEIEKIVFDVDSIGFAGHSGSTIVVPVTLLKTFLDLDYIAQNGSFGIFFFIAQNRVKKEWTFYGNNDVPAAVIALKAMESATGKAPTKFFDVPALLSNALTNPKKSGTFELVAAMIPPIEKFGWSALEKTFAKYNNAKKPKTETEVDKYESFFALWSKETKCNLGKYFECFGFQYSSVQKARLEKMKDFDSPLFPPELGMGNTSEDCFFGDAPLGSVEIFFSDYDPKKSDDEEMISAEIFDDEDSENEQQGGEEDDLGNDENSENEENSESVPEENVVPEEENSPKKIRV